MNETTQTHPIVNIDILIFKDEKVLLGLLTKNWLYNGKQVYGVPGRDIRFGEEIGECVKRNITEEFNCKADSYEVFGVNANYAGGNHYIGIGITAQISGEIKLLKQEDWEKWEWFDLDKLPKNIFPSAKNALDSYMKQRVCVSE